MAITLNGSTGIATSGGYTGDGISFADGTPSNTLITTTGGNVGIGTSSASSARLTVRSGTGTAHTILGNDYGSLYLETASGGPNRITSLNSSLSAGQALAFNGGGGAEWGRFDTSGNFRINNTNTALWVGSEKLTVVGFSLFKQSGTPVLAWNTDASGGLIAFSAGSTRVDVGSITTNGTGTSYTTASDYRLKENVARMTGALEKVIALKPVTYTWKSNGSTGQGFIAHELQSVVPDCVIGAKDAMDDKGKPIFQSVDTSHLVATLVSAIQEQQALITQLQADVAALKGATP